MLPTECKNCPLNTYFLTSNSSCVACNVNGYFISGSNCTQCDPSCRTCDGTLATNCLSCPSSPVATYLLSSNHSCVACNADRYFISGSECLQCDSSCLTCNGALPTNCLSCPSTPIATYLLSSNQSCVACNVAGYSPVGPQCIECDPSCVTCSGTTPTDCITCPPSKYLLSTNHSCVDCDVDGYSQVDSQCFQCDLSCLTCSGSTPTSCVTCPPSKYLLLSNHSCVDCNGDGYVISGSECLQCDSSCLTCNGISSNNCLSCVPEKTLQNFTCLILDPPNDFLNYTAGESAKIVSQAQTIVSVVMPALTGGVSTSAMLLVGFLADVDIYTYINVPFPDNFVTFIEQMRSSILPNLFANMDTVYDGNNPSSTIGKFRFWGLSATLLDNSNTTIFKDLVVLGIILGLNILVLLFKSYPSINSSILKIRTIFMWNVFLSYYMGDFSELQLNSMVQLRENSVWSGYTILSFVFAVIIVISYPPLLGYLMYKTNQRHSQPEKVQRRRVHNESNPNLQNQQWVKVPPSIEFLVEDFHDTNSFTRNYIFVMLLETFLQILIIFFFQDNGLSQAILYTIIIAVSIVLIAWQRPYRSKLQMGILLLNQASKAVMGIHAILLGVDSTIQFLSPESIEAMGSVLTILILTVIGINSLLSIGILLVSLFQSIKGCCLRANYRKKQPRVQSSRKRMNIKLTSEPRAMEDNNRSLNEDASFGSHNGLNNKNRSRVLFLSKDTSMSLISEPIDSSGTKTVLNAARRNTSNNMHSVIMQTKMPHDPAAKNYPADSFSFSRRERRRKHLSSEVNRISLK